MILEVAPAISDDNTILAIRLRNNGVHSYNNRDWNAALSQFTDSYNYSQQTMTAYYLALTYFRVGSSNAEIAIHWANQAIRRRTIGQEKWVEASKRIISKIHSGDWLMSASPDGFSIAHPELQDENCYFTNGVSEETPPAVCANGYFVNGIVCRGSHCDNKHLKCCRSIKGFSHANTSWSYWFSEERSGHFFDAGRALIGLACNHDYCDNISVLSMPLPTGPSGACYSTPFYSEELGYQECSPNHLVSGIACHGGYCDDIALYCCPE